MKGPSKRDKPKTKLKTQVRKVPTRSGPSSNSYLANYDSRKEQKKKILQSNASSKRGGKIKSDQRSRGEQSQNSEQLLNTGSDFLKDAGPGKSTFFKKKEPGVKVCRVEAPIAIYQDVAKVSPFVGEYGKGVSLSKTDDLKFLKDIARGRKSKSRRGSSAYIQENSRNVQSSHNSQKGALLPEERNNQQMLSQSLVMRQKDSQINQEKTNSGSSRNSRKEIEYLKQKYLGHQGKVRIHFIFSTFFDFLKFEKTTVFNIKGTNICLLKYKNNKLER